MGKFLRQLLPFEPLFKLHYAYVEHLRSFYVFNFVRQYSIMLKWSISKEKNNNRHHLVFLFSFTMFFDVCVLLRTYFQILVLLIAHSTLAMDLQFLMIITNYLITFLLSFFLENCMYSLKIYFYKRIILN